MRALREESDPDEVGGSPWNRSIGFTLRSSGAGVELMTPAALTDFLICFLALPSYLLTPICDFENML